MGKTWIIREFGEQQYEQMVYFNFEKDPAIKNIFSHGFDTQKIIAGLRIFANRDINPSTTLIVFDEIQEAPNAITSLKYFQENAPEYHIICAGSLLGVALHTHISFPVGKVNFLDLYPLSFPEFMEAVGEVNLLHLLENPDWKMVNSFSEKFIELLRLYYFIGGMPEAVSSYNEDRDFDRVRKIQLEILAAYEQDFSKHAASPDVTRIRMVWNSVSAQLAKENKKFVYGLLRQGARAKTYESALTWLKDCGLIHQVFQVSKPELPLKAFETFNAFKVYLVDVGLLGAMTATDKRLLLEKNTIFSQFKGALTEQYVMQQLATFEQLPVYYWSADGGRAEVDFVIQIPSKIVPIEVKAEENLQAKSLSVYAKKFGSDLVIRTSMSNYRDEGWMQNIPLYALPFFVRKLLGL